MGTMFYMHFLVNKRGPLAKIWLAAHWEKKLTKAHIFECNLETTVEKIISPKFTIALRTSGHLLLGVVRIYHRKAKYLLADCSEALAKMKTAFRPGLVDLPAENFEAAYQTITLPEEFHDFATPLPELNAIDVAEHFTLNQSRAEDITLTEDYESNILLCDRNFAEEPDTLRKESFFDGSIFTSSNSLVADHNSASLSGHKAAPHGYASCLEYDCFGDEEDTADMIEMLLRDEQNGLDKDILDMEEERPLSRDLPENSTAIESNSADATLEVSHLTNEMTLLLKEEEGFVLEPVDDTAITQRKKNKRKRKLLVDVQKELSCSTIYNQLNNCTDLLDVLDLAPPTKKTMMWKKWGGVDNLLSHAAQPVVHPDLQKLFEKCFKSHRFKMRRDGIQRESEIEETRKDQETTEMPTVEEPSSVHSETERKAGNDSFMLTSWDNRNRTEDICGETVMSSFQTFQNGRAFSESSSLVNNSLDHEARMQQAELTNDLRRNGKDGEEMRWSKRTLQLLKTLQHLKESGMRSFSLRELCQQNNRKEAAAKFYIFLVLKKQLVIELAQRAPFADITATIGPRFNIP
ncbi:double-strand-break repair protein rad21-like protein 1 [Phaenicophaeus curvirostris]|uniref:double-strand-break repair protein rad21-like protein 1 n=1 Tax=Phaenicophaeus curvirostris TaxID=33595 RepID=UPI0037F0C542